MLTIEQQVDERGNCPITTRLSPCSQPVSVFSNVYALLAQMFDRTSYHSWNMYPVLLFSKQGVGPCSYDGSSGENKIILL